LSKDLHRLSRLHIAYIGYVCQDRCRLSDRYVFDDGHSYRKTVQVNAMSVFYDVAEDASHRIDERMLSHCTLNCWIGFPGDLKQTLAQARQPIRTKSPSCELYGCRVSVASWKYRSEHRKGLLHAGGRLLQAYHNLF